MLDLYTDPSHDKNQDRDPDRDDVRNGEAGSIALLDSISRGIAALVDRVGPAVVRVETASNGRPSGGIGSGVVISPDGLVLTNSHVVHGHRDARLADSEGRRMEARLIGEDRDTDLALLRVTAARQLVSAISPSGRSFIKTRRTSRRTSSSTNAMRRTGSDVPSRFTRAANWDNIPRPRPVGGG